MYGKNLTQGNKTKAGWRRWSRANSASRRFKQRSLPHTIRSSNKTPIRHRYAIQHVQQRSITSLMATHERKAWVVIFRLTSKSKGGVIGARIDCANSPRASTKQSKLVWPHMVSVRQNKRLRGECYSLASWDLCKMETCNTTTKTQSPRKHKKLSSPYIGQIDHFIYPYLGQMTMAIYPYIGLIGGVFHGFPYPYIGHLLDIPLYTALIGD
ncbi:hypothetical protein GALL_256400 [mine drainage metagenome]|uniref:Uncharacterized protein n=1 Tax=mine drainage metagenome TaxID=410659 RepID=A0A1J5RSF3_9ZZZZ